MSASRAMASARNKKAGGNNPNPAANMQDQQSLNCRSSKDPVKSPILSQRLLFLKLFRCYHVELDVT